jgi:hypothetical protein
MYCFFYAIARLDLVQAVLLNFSAPLLRGKRRRGVPDHGLSA